ncbi:unnamed protein product, partial [Pylaiella littoralis]
DISSLYVTCTFLSFSQEEKQPKAKLRGGRSGKPVGRNGGVAAVKDVGQKQLGTVVPVAGGMSATEESKREQADLVARHMILRSTCLRLIACLLFYFIIPPPRLPVLPVFPLHLYVFY